MTDGGLIQQPTEAEAQTPQSSEIEQPEAALPTADVEQPESAAPTADEVLEQIQRVRAADILAILREPEFVLLRMATFSGFRTSTQTLGQALVKKRLAVEGSRIPEFVKRLAVLDTASAPAEKPAPVAEKPETDPLTDQARQDLEKERERRRLDREQSREQVRALKADAADLRSQISALQAEAKANQAALQTLTETLTGKTQLVERLERRLVRAHAERDALLTDAPASPGGRRHTAHPAKRGHPGASHASPSPWAEAVSRLVSHNHPRIALQISAEVLRQSPKDLDALRLTVQAHLQLGDIPSAAQACATLAEAYLERGQTVPAMEEIARMLTMDPATPLLTMLSRPLTAAIKRASPHELREAARHVQRLQATKAANRLIDLLTRFVPPASLQYLMPPATNVSLDAPLALKGLPSHYAGVTARGVIDAVNANDTRLVSAVRKALHQLKATDVKRYDEIVAALQEAMDGDESVLTPLLKTPTRAAVMDASNAAWFDQDSLVSGRARIRHIQELRKALRIRGYFPVAILGDAPLPYTIDDPDELRAMIARHEIALVDSGVDADEQLIREAQRLGAALVTNDYMTDWDPDGMIPKIRFGIPASGAAYLLG